MIGGRGWRRGLRPCMRRVFRGLFGLREHREEVQLVREVRAKEYESVMKMRTEGRSEMERISWEFRVRGMHRMRHAGRVEEKEKASSLFRTKVAERMMQLSSSLSQDSRSPRPLYHGQSRLGDLVQIFPGTSVSG